MLESRAVKPLLIAAQVAGAWVVGAVAMPLALQILLIAAFAGGTSLLVVAVAVSLAVVMAYLIVLVKATHQASPLGATAWRRAAWAGLVLGAGTAGWALGWAATDAAGLGVSGDAQATLLLGGLPYALVAGMLLRPWPFSAAALALSVALTGAGVVALRREPPDDLERRLAIAHLPRETAYAVAIPGYVPGDDRDYGGGLGGGGFRPADPAAVPGPRYLTTTVHEGLRAGERMCGQPTATDSRLSWGSCRVEADGLVYRHNANEHGYQVSVGRRFVTVIASPAVSHDLVRAAARTVRPATAGELGDGHEQTGAYYAVTVPGYRGRPSGTPPGMVYEPLDHAAAGPHSVTIALHVTYANDDSLCFLAVECTRDAAGLTYARHDDRHSFTVRRGGLDVRVEGGLKVAGTLLRQAALDARPVTDAELRRILPPLKPGDHLDRFRRWLRTF
ncbi:hypothetical protein ACIBG7_29595 [Nonomuraea sp. NPDC050328]|uniref:hypothetical protein n=1 Tax=Nonomuraea sp. NPDC050328 TaxID=3364361 RepID=UPI0037ABA19D